MISMSSTLPVERIRFDDGNGLGSWVTPYLGLTAPENAPPPGMLHPTAFLVEYDPNREVRAHYHWADQFQVFLRGSGSVGKRSVHPISVHYADAYSPYGPLRSGPDGLSYLTLRNGWDPGQRYMPDNRAELAAAKRKPRIATADDVPCCTDAHLTGGRLDIVLETTSDGAAATFHHVGPGEMVSGPDPASGGGQYWLEVLAVDGEVALHDFSFVGPRDEAFTLRADGHARHLLLLQFPLPRRT